ncbi:MAG TPA: DUF2235 domain-containing protein [Thermoanaerobaculia bacterium]
MKKLIVCCDGTWNQADQVRKDGQPCVTNVLKMAVRTAKRDGDVPQLIYYDQGVGTGNAADKLFGGAFGDGLEANIYDAYRFLVGNYELGDEVYLFGFSRGAFTARSIAGIVRKCGILGRQHADKYHDAVELYHSDHDPDDKVSTDFRAQNSLSPKDQIEIKFIGVWDTVGALGIPVRGLAALQKGKFEFYDTELSGSVRFAYHALAIDERRGPFRPTLWDYKPKPGQTVEQVWFCGVHSDVGGGYEEVGFSDIALQWMLDKAEKAGLVLDGPALAARPLHPEPMMAPLHNSMTVVYHLTPAYDRPVGLPSPNSKNAGPNGLDPTQSVHSSVLQRWDNDPKYRPGKLRDYFKRSGDTARANG